MAIAGVVRKRITAKRRRSKELADAPGHTSAVDLKRSAALFFLPRSRCHAGRFTRSC